MLSHFYLFAVVLTVYVLLAFSVLITLVLITEAHLVDQKLDCACFNHIARFQYVSVLRLRMLCLEAYMLCVIVLIRVLDNIIKPVALVKRIQT